MKDNGKSSKGPWEGRKREIMIMKGQYTCRDEERDKERQRIEKRGESGNGGKGKDREKGVGDRGKGGGEKERGGDKAGDGGEKGSRENRESGRRKGGGGGGTGDGEKKSPVKWKKKKRKTQEKKFECNATYSNTYCAYICEHLME